jgi:XTP/dITP diphosphohydrolase
MRPLFFATTNGHKLREVRAILEPLGFEVRSLESLAERPAEPLEDAATFAGNARLKAVAYARAMGQECLAEDSGLVVDALGGAPGVHSARYAGVEGGREERDRANNEKLIRELRGVPDERRTARFVCALCVATPDGKVVVEAMGECEGTIAPSPRGTGGFGYDPLFFLPDAACTQAELSPEQKDARSHRGRAVRAFAEVVARATVAR